MIKSLKTEQVELLRFLWRNPKQHVLEILPCGGGKTLPVILLGLLYELLMPNHIVHIIVLCPFKCVVAEWKKKCAGLQNKHFVHVVRGDDECPVSSSCKIVLMSCDSLTFGYGIKTLNLIGRNVVRFVIDEAHVVLQDSRTYRFRLNRVPQLTQFLPRPYLLLSGTYSPDLEAETFQFYGTDSGSWKIFRNSTERQNISIVLKRLVNTNSVQQAVARFVETFREHASTNENSRCMIFVGTRREAENFARDYNAVGTKSGSIDTLDLNSDFS